MARPRKNRAREHAGQLIVELAALIGEAVASAIAETRREQNKELAALRAEVRRLSRKLDAAHREKPVRAKLGKWVPGGPGRPPKDAAARIAAFAERRRSAGRR